MKLLNVKWKWHPILGDLELDFVNPKTGKAYDTIVLAGENGAGKTTVLHTLNDFLCVGPVNIFEYIKYEVEGRVYQARHYENNAHPNGEKFFHIYNENDMIVRRGVNYAGETDENRMLNPCNYGCVFTRAISNYKAKKVASSTAAKVDKDIHDRGNKDNAEELKQMLVDLQEQYNEEHTYWFERHRNDKNIDDKEVYERSKIRRFKEAFDNFFGNIKYVGVKTEDGEKKVIFEKEGKEISIDSLSTGEKQIVFRGAQILRNVRRLDSAIVMVDEPEISMHPKWQQRIMRYYRDLFKRDGNQEVQLFFATHSEYVVRSALQDKDNTLVIVLRQNNGNVEKETITAPKCLPTITSAEVNYLAFAIPTVDYHQQLYSAIQQGMSVKACDEYIAKQAKYNAGIHYNPSSHNNTTYKTVCTYVRNRIDHPDCTGTYTDNQLALSIELMREILIADKPKEGN